MNTISKMNTTTYNEKRKDLIKLCKERNIKYPTRMSRQEMIEVLKWNDEDKSILCHPNSRRRVLEYTKGYRDKNPEQREKAKECSRRWRINNPEKVKEYFSKWQESVLRSET